MTVGHAIGAALAFSGPAPPPSVELAVLAREQGIRVKLNRWSPR